MTALGIYIESYTPDALYIEEAFSEAVKELIPHRISPVHHLFALNGLGEMPPMDAIIGNSD